MLLFHHFLFLSFVFFTHRVFCTAWHFSVFYCCFSFQPLKNNKTKHLWIRKCFSWAPLWLTGMHQQQSWPKPWTQNLNPCGSSSQIWLRLWWISSEIWNCEGRKSVNSPVELQCAINSSQSLKLKPPSTCLHACSRVEAAKLITCPVNILGH